MQRLEPPKELVRMFHVETNTVAANRNDSLAAGFHLADLNNRSLSWTSVLSGIVQQIHENLFHQSGIAIDSGQGSDPPLALTAERLGRPFVHNKSNERVTR